MRFTTRVNIEPLQRRIDYSHGGLSLGSCFAENIAARMRRVKLPVVSNPFGVLFNPVSVVDTISSLAAERIFSNEDLVRHDDLWSSFAFHGDFSSDDAKITLGMMNDAVRDGVQILTTANYIILTFGTAWVYEFAGLSGNEHDYAVGGGVQAGQVVANCHKFPASAFNRRRLTVAQIVEKYDALLCTGGVLEGKNVIMTVSPVRHVGDGLRENNLSKAILLLAVEQLVAKYDNVSYFQAYEIVCDELRDYRFYGPDMVHPSAVAVDYIWDRFSENVLSADAASIAVNVEKIVSAGEHRPLNPDTQAHRKFMESMLAKTTTFQKSHPEVDMAAEIEYFSRLMSNE